MRVAGIAEVKRGLSEFLAGVRGGEEVLVTERGRPIARIVPVGEHDGHNGRVRELERNGGIRLGSGALPPGFWDLPRPADGSATVRSALIEERDNAR